jgi:hypothetical protein
MKTLLVIALYMATIVSGAVNAAPIQYRLTASHVSEWDNDNNLLPEADWFFAAGTKTSSTFFYDNAGPLALSLPAGVFGPNFGATSIYVGITNFAGTAGDYTFSSATVISYVANADSGDPTYHDALVHASNYDAVGRPFGDWTLNQVALRAGGSADFLSSQQLPDTPLANAPDSLFGLIFTKSNDELFTVEYHTVVFNIDELTPVPLPTSGFMFGGALLGLSINLRKRRTTQSH